ncbi:putative Tetratricopeptide TPR_1 repeat-containing protein [uncultured Desulfobacterium sp.]|uniref:Putative Tetratricopeptide TPR_1 repeat-containing protein n=1 Tax=uncultured Desulfobacterium sp. TaxID=201089 RepID=A0A445N2H9_9BACT|nr:putative Tetratricopeptide TPR_1 repeat-containing protein [uncultured Desulfobacterium sp.]
MDTMFSALSDALMSSTYTTQASLDGLSQNALSHGIELYMNGDYQGAVKEFRRSIGLSPNSDYSVDAGNYLANAYLQLDDVEKAISTYQKSIRLNPLRDDIHVSLGNLYFGLNRFEDAEQEYKEAARIYPDANNCFSLGQAYLYGGKLNEAETTFGKVKSIAPGSAMGDYGLGQTYSKQGRYEKAIEHFQQAIQKKDDLYDAYVEMGYAYADMGKYDEANEIKKLLNEKDPSRGLTLGIYMYQVKKPGFSLAYYPEAFGSYPARTPLSFLNSYLKTANASKTLNIEIVFDKEMDRASVENLANWQITRQYGSGPGETYNFGLPLPSTEVTIPFIPTNVYYDKDTLSATVRFKVTQNSTADGTIDPAHIQFKFLGKDLYGLSMDPAADQYSAFSGIA